MEIVLMLAYFLLVVIIIEISAHLFVLTGLDKKIARYQAISMLTNTGFTTDEAKLILEHPIRRRLSSFLILFGAFSLAVIISILSAYLSKDIRYFELGVILVAAFLVFVLLKLNPVRKFLKKKLTADLKMTYQLDELPIREVLYFQDDDFLIDVHITGESRFTGKECGLLNKNKKDLFILLVKRGEEILRKDLDELCIQEGDVVYVYGNKMAITDTFSEELEAQEEKIEAGNH